MRKKNAATATATAVLRGARGTIVLPSNAPGDMTGVVAMFLTLSQACVSLPHTREMNVHQR